MPPPDKLIPYLAPLIITLALYLHIWNIKKTIKYKITWSIIVLIPIAGWILYLFFGMKNKSNPFSDSPIPPGGAV